MTAMIAMTIEPHEMTTIATFRPALGAARTTGINAATATTGQRKGSTNGTESVTIQFPPATSANAAVDRPVASCRRARKSAAMSSASVPGTTQNAGSSTYTSCAPMRNTMLAAAAMMSKRMKVSRTPRSSLTASMHVEGR